MITIKFRQKPFFSLVYIVYSAKNKIQRLPFSNGDIQVINHISAFTIAMCDFVTATKEVVLISLLVNTCYAICIINFNVSNPIITGGAGATTVRKMLETSR